MTSSLSVVSYTDKLVHSSMRGPWNKIGLFCIGVVLVLILLYNTVKSQTVVTGDLAISSQNKVTTFSRKVKYILQWTNPDNDPFVYMGQGHQGFIDRKCPHQNCIVTDNRSFLGDYSKFDVIAFAGADVLSEFIEDLPTKRSPNQKYVFASMESADNYPACTNNFDGYFNWTWTYKLDSEVQWGYITIRDKNKNIVGPSKDMHWKKLEDMDPVSEDFKKQLKTKTKAAAWFVSNCQAKSRRDVLSIDIAHALKKYNLSVDFYGKCGSHQCPHSNEEACNNIVKKSYYFYFSFENSFSEDYVTEKLLRALKNDAVPIVYGGANYTRFMPDGIYLNGRDLGAEATAAKMYELIKNPEKYAEYFKWKNHYSYHSKSESVGTNPYCLFCAHLNNVEMVKKTTIYKEFRNWWDPPQRCKG